MARFAGQRDDGRYAYVVTTRWFDQITEQLVWEVDITAAKQAHGFSNVLHTTKRVRRANAEDVARLDRG